VRVVLGGKPVADTARGFVSHEVGLPDRYYIPRDDVRATISEGTGAGVCPWKGKWKHLDVEVDGKRVANGAWTYYETTPLCEPLRDKVAFYENKVERIDVE
jgi:uncharacterized protein (DUF427 family)